MMENHWERFKPGHIFQLKNHSCCHKKKKKKKTANIKVTIINNKKNEKLSNLIDVEGERRVTNQLDK